MGVMAKLRAERQPETGQISEIADAYLDIVGGADGFRQYAQNTGDPGPHPGPFWEQIVIHPDIPQ